MEQDPFEAWEQDFVNVEVPKSRLDEIIDASVDPLQGALNIKEVFTNVSLEGQNSLVRRAISKLALRHYGQFSGRELLTRSALGFAIPEYNKIKAKRFEIQTPMRFEDNVNVLGTYDGLNPISYRGPTDPDDAMIKLGIAVQIAEPYVLDRDGQVMDRFQLPDYMVVPISTLQDYTFTNTGNAYGQSF